MERIQYKVELLDHSSITQQVQVFKQAFGLETDDNELLEFWEKKHYHNPLGNSLMFGVFIDGVLAGMNAYLPSTFNYKGRPIKCLQSCESGVNPAFQGKGIWGTVVRHAVDFIFNETDYEFIFGFPNYRNSYPGFVKMKWETVHNMKNFLLVNNASTFVKTITSNRVLSALSFPLLLQKKYVQLFSSKILCIEDCMPDELLWDNDNDFITVKPTDEWIKWKQDYRKEHFLKVTYDGAIIASCIYILDKHNDFPIVRLDRVTVPNNSRINPKVVMASILTYLCKMYPDSAFIRTWVLEKSDNQALLNGLFLIKSNHANPFILKQRDST